MMTNKKEVIKMVQRGNPVVREWMKKHEEEVAKVQQKYDELKDASIGSLLKLAIEVDADLSKARDKLITAIVAVKGTK